MVRRLGEFLLETLQNVVCLAQQAGDLVVRWKNEWSYLAQVPRALTTTDSGAQGVGGTNAKGQSVSPLGFPRDERRAWCCVPAPSVLQLDREGNLLQAWGGPADPGFLETKCRVAEGV